MADTAVDRLRDVTEVLHHLIAMLIGVVVRHHHVVVTIATILHHHAMAADIVVVVDTMVHRLVVVIATMVLRVVITGVDLHHHVVAIMADHPLAAAVGVAVADRACRGFPS